MRAPAGRAGWKACTVLATRISRHRACGLHHAAKNNSPRGERRPGGDEGSLKNFGSTPSSRRSDGGWQVIVSIAIDEAHG